MTEPHQPHWVRSSRCGHGEACVEVAKLPYGYVAVRNSHEPHGPWLRFTPAEWAAFLHGARNNEFD